MRVALRSILIIFLWNVAAFADEPAAALSASDRQSIREVIQAQIAAFKRDDGETAFSFAAPSIREQFRTSQAFMFMVRTGYAPVYRPKRVEFQEVVGDAKRPTQQVALTGPDDRDVIALYIMERQPTGAWKIAGVALAEPRGEKI